MEQTWGVSENACPIRLVLLMLDARYDCPTLRWRYTTGTSATSRLQDGSFTRPTDHLQCRVFVIAFYIFQVPTPSFSSLSIVDFQLFTVLYCPYCTITDCDRNRPLREYYHSKSCVQTRTLELLQSPVPSSILFFNPHPRPPFLQPLRLQYLLPCSEQDTKHLFSLAHLEIP